MLFRSQQVLAHEAGVTGVVDPLGGSYYVEALTDQIEDRANALIADVERRGGMVRAIESGWAQQQLADASWSLQREIESGERVVVGLNRFVEDEPGRTEIHRHAERFEEEQARALEALRRERDADRVAAALAELRSAAASEANLMPALIEAVKADATIGEMCGVLRRAFGEYRATQIY